MSIQLHTLFIWCHDVEPMRHFYNELLGLEETFYRNDDEHGWLTYQTGTAQLVFMRGKTPPTIETEWAKTPGYEGGTQEIHSWAFNVSDEAFNMIVQRLIEAGVPRFSEDVIQIGDYRQFIVRDPMGKTIEITNEA